MYNMNSGYCGYSMSDRARQAYDSGEKPLSRWTKAEIISAIEEVDAVKAELFKNVNLATLKEKVLYQSSWHHTSSRCNATDFYSVDEDFIREITRDEILKMTIRKPKEKISSNKYRGTIHYLVWSGTRNYPKATEEKLENVNIEERGCFYYVSDDEGKQLLKKKIGSTGTEVTRL